MKIKMQFTSRGVTYPCHHRTLLFKWVGGGGDMNERKPTWQLKVDFLSNVYSNPSLQIQVLQNFWREGHRC